MKDHADVMPRDFWLAVILTAICAVTLVAIHYATRITPEREAELKAEGAAEADRKAATAGGWDKWIAKEVSADGRDARRPSWEVCRD